MPLEEDNYYRFVEIKNSYNDGLNIPDKMYRSEYSRDYARVLHCPSFRRLQNKTQLFPGQESDFFRNRLTHSLEVSQIAKDIANKFILEYDGEAFISPEVCEIAGLLHDIGHPPFGHNGERALDDCMRERGGFEGNAQTMHIILRTEKKELIEGILFDEQGKDLRCGLNLTARSIASALKYDHVIPVYRDNNGPIHKGYYDCDKELVDIVKEKISGDTSVKDFKTIECSIMDVADDIAYSTYDIEDAFKAGFLTPLKILSERDYIYEQISDKLKELEIDKSADDCRTILCSLFYETLVESKEYRIKSNKSYEYNDVIDGMNMYLVSEELASDGYFRNGFSSYLVSRFIDGLSLKKDNEHPVLSQVIIDEDTKVLINILKHFSYICLINSPRLKVVENRGYDIIKKMFNRLSQKDGYKLLPEDFRELYLMVETDDVAKNRVICDFISGMTDRYAIEFYGRLFSDNPQTIFKPL